MGAPRLGGGGGEGALAGSEFRLLSPELCGLGACSRFWLGWGLIGFLTLDALGDRALALLGFDSTG